MLYQKQKIFSKTIQNNSKEIKSGNTIERNPSIS
jgi:hypothetical protein